MGRVLLHQTRTMVWWSARFLVLKVGPAILIQYTFCLIERIAPHSPLAVRCVCVHSKTSGVRIKSWLCEWKNKHSGLEQIQPINKLRQEHGQEGCHLIG